MILGSYEVISELGSGTFGTVLKVRDMKSSEIMAVKCISKSKIQRNKMGDQVKKEINTMKILRHPNITQIKDVLMDKNHLYITMEYVSGGELYSKIATGGKMSEDVARLYFKQVMEGVRYCHELNICHRDIKPENILLDKNDVVKIADFGFASLMEIEDYKRPSRYLGSSIYQNGKVDIDEFIVDQENATDPQREGFKRMESKIMRKLSTVCGTSMYMAPEIMKNTGYFGDKADIWSCGVVLYYLLMYSLPFESSALESLSNDTFETTYRISSTLSQDVRDLLSNLLMYNPKNRFSARKSLNHSWFHSKGKIDTETKKQHPLEKLSSSPEEMALPDIKEVVSFYEGEKDIVSVMEFSSCLNIVGKVLRNLSWLCSPPGKGTKYIKASKMTDTGMALIQLVLDERKSGNKTVTIVTLDIFGDNISSGASDICTLMDRIRSLLQ